MSACTHDIETSFHPAAGLAARISDTIRLWRERVRERHAFHTLGHRELRDLGLSRWEAERELAKPFWRG